MPVKSETHLLNKLQGLFQAADACIPSDMISELGEIVRMSSMMMQNDRMWNYTVELCQSSKIWDSLSAIISLVLEQNAKFNITQLRAIKGVVLLIRNLSITYRELHSNTLEFNKKHVASMNSLIHHLDRMYKDETDGELCLKSLDVSIVSFHCVFNFVQSSQSNKEYLKEGVELLGVILVQMEDHGGLFELRQILPQFKAYCLIPESKAEITKDGCFAFVHLLAAMSRILKIRPNTDMGELRERKEEEYRMLVLLAHLMMHLFDDEKVGMSLVKLEKNADLKYNGATLLYMVACQLTFSSQPADCVWDYVSLGAISLEFFKLYKSKCTLLLQDKYLDDGGKSQLLLYHRKMAAILDIISNLLQFELFKKTLNSYSFLESLLDFFDTVESNTERKRLKDCETEGTADGEKKEFAFIKSIIVEIVTYLVYDDKANQNLVREKGGLVLILNNCNLDVNEPFIRERCILCLKYLLEENSENQSFVASLEAKGVEINKENEAILEKCGYEVEIVDGKVQLKKNGSPDDKIQELK